jgi:hypothetical protein
MDLQSTNCVLARLLDNITQLDPDISSAAEALFGKNFWACVSKDEMRQTVSEISRKKRILLYNMTYPGSIDDNIKAAVSLKKTIRKDERLKMSLTPV